MNCYTYNHTDEKIMQGLFNVHAVLHILSSMDGNVCSIEYANIQYIEI